ncbi:MAG: radical SAM protein [Planctomycetota bacterium]|jgi:putative pyruvate formate lyase activating enzyme
MIQSQIMDNGSDRIYLHWNLLESCEICPRKCGVNRLEDERGFCKGGRDTLVASAHGHFGEEPVLVGFGGSGTIFLGGCNLGCVFCQNYDISHHATGSEVSVERLVNMIIGMQETGSENVNFVTPTHFSIQILNAIKIAKKEGLRVPTVWNSGGYDSVETLKLLEGHVDIYMPDAKYWDNDVAEKYSSAPDYREVMCAALKEMHRQVGDLEVGERGVATRGLMVRHLVLPGGLAGTKEICDFIADELSPNTYVNIMAQYRPCYNAACFAEIRRHPTREEFRGAYDYAESKGFRMAR